jgi:hypothetical protein
MDQACRQPQSKGGIGGRGGADPGEHQGRVRDRSLHGRPDWAADPSCAGAWPSCPWPSSSGTCRGSMLSSRPVQASSPVSPPTQSAAGPRPACCCAARSPRCFAGLAHAAIPARLVERLATEWGAHPLAGAARWSGASSGGEPLTRAGWGRKRLSRHPDSVLEAAITSSEARHSEIGAISVRGAVRRAGRSGGRARGRGSSAGALPPSRR